MCIKAAGESLSSQGSPVCLFPCGVETLGTQGRPGDRRLATGQTACQAFNVVRRSDLSVPCALQNGHVLNTT